jgi:DNA invertase Pin-like site-specific DNA recombinase
MRRLGYIRTSTDDQLIDRQIDLLRASCDRLFIEKGVSAVRRRRPVYERVVKQLQRGDVFVVLALDRAFRSVPDALAELQQLQRRGVGFLSLSQGFDASTPDGKLMFTVIAAMAAWERDTISVRTKQGMAAARRRGQVLGRPRKLSAAQIAKARRRLAAAAPPSLATIARSLHVHERTLSRAIRQA